MEEWMLQFQSSISHQKMGIFFNERVLFLGRDVWEVERYKKKN
jgi:hypothetical protein